MKPHYLKQLCYKRISSCFSYVYIVEVWMHAEVWGTLKKLELLSDVAASNTYAPSQTSRVHTCVKQLILS